jgi:hypothetical protein
MQLGAVLHSAYFELEFPTLANVRKGELEGLWSTGVWEGGLGFGRVLLLACTHTRTCTHACAHMFACRARWPQEGLGAVQKEEARCGGSDRGPASNRPSLEAPFRRRASGTKVSEGQPTSSSIVACPDSYPVLAST